MNLKNKIEFNNNKVFISLFYTVILEAIYYSIITYSDINNMVKYILGCVFFMISFFINYLNIANINFQKKHILIISFLSGIYFVFLYFGEISPDISGRAETYLRHRINWIFYFLSFILACIISFFCIKKTKLNNKVFRLIVGIVFTIAEACFLYVSNPVEDNMYHIHAYDNSIINVMFGVPYLATPDDIIGNLSIYGHYGILFYLPVKLLMMLGINMYTSIILVIVFIGSLSYGACNYIIAKIAKSDSVYVLGILATSISSFRSNIVYYQGNPHRRIFPVLILLGILLYIESTCDNKMKINKNRKLSIMVWITCSLAMLWNLETGIVMTIVWTFCQTYILLTRTTHKNVLKILGYQIIKMVVSFLSGYIVVGIYNIICKGGFGTLRMYIYPYFSGTYTMDAIAIKLPGITNGYWWAMIMIFLSVLMYYFLRILNGQVLSKQGLFQFCSALSALGLIFYYANRATIGNIEIANFNLVFILIFYITEMETLGFNKAKYNDIVTKKDLNQFFSSVSIVVLTYFALSSIANIGQSYEAHKEKGWNGIPYYTLCNNINNTITDDTIALGRVAVEVFAHNEKDPGIHSLDWSDRSEGHKKVYEEANNYDSILTSIDLRNLPEYFADYEMVEEYYYGLYIFRKKE